MTLAATLFLLVNAAALLFLPRKWAALPLLVGACYMTLGQGITVGPFSFPIIRLLVLVGCFRVVIRLELPSAGLNGMDRLMLAWGSWALCASAFHEQPASYLVGQMGLVYNTLGIYFLVRCFCQTTEDIVRLGKVVAILLVPVAFEMIQEQVTERNLFSVFGGVPDFVTVRNDRLRSQGPFAHPILAGTVGAVCAPLMAGIYRESPWLAKAGLSACLAIVVASASSGPLISLVLSGLALVLWRWRHRTGQMRIAAVLGYILLNLVMNAPAYYLIARIDVAGGSTGWHRAALIESAIKHLDEWWWAGTDYTRHWMPTGVSWSKDHADITNHYVQMGVSGGLALMLLFIGTVWLGFRYVGQSLPLRAEALEEDEFLVWTLGASLFAHAATCISVSYFDQSFLFLYLNLAVISSLRSALHASAHRSAKVVDPMPDYSSDLRSSQFRESDWAGFGR